MKTFKDFLSKDGTINENYDSDNGEFLFEKSAKILNLPSELKGVEQSILGSKLTHFFVEFKDPSWKKPIFAKVSYKMKDGQIADNITGAIEVSDIDYNSGEIVNIYYMHTKNSAKNIETKDLKKFISSNKK